MIKRLLIEHNRLPLDGGFALIAVNRNASECFRHCNMFSRFKLKMSNPARVAQHVQEVDNVVFGRMRECHMCIGVTEELSIWVTKNVWHY